MESAVFLPEALLYIKAKGKKKKKLRVCVFVRVSK